MRAESDVIPVRKAVSLNPSPAAIRSMSSRFRPSASMTTPAGLPEFACGSFGVGVKAR
jgi:hypothetical protein